MKLPEPAPSVVNEPAIVGPVVVAQHTPLAVTADPLSLVIFPPDTAVVAVIEVTLVVVRSGTCNEFVIVVKEISFP